MGRVDHGPAKALLRSWHIKTLCHGNTQVFNLWLKLQENRKPQKTIHGALSHRGVLVPMKKSKKYRRVSASPALQCKQTGVLSFRKHPSPSTALFKPDTRFSVCVRYYFVDSSFACFSVGHIS